jgi:hypothetical protein
VDKWNGERVVGAVSGGFGLVSAPTKNGGVERFATWVSLDTIEKLLMWWTAPAPGIDVP